MLLPMPQLLHSNISSCGQNKDLATRIPDHVFILMIVLLHIIEPRPRLMLLILQASSHCGK